jgi:hypothetical protein
VEPPSVLDNFKDLFFLNVRWCLPPAPIPRAGEGVAELMDNDEYD